MRLSCSDGSPLWLTYGMNVHPGGDARATLDALTTVVRPLRERLGAPDPFGLVVRWDAAGVEALRRDADLRARLRATLREEGLVPFAGNAFVHGDFHGRPLKQAVYEPPWSDPRREIYTLGFAEVLADLAEPGETVSLSTSPCAWRDARWSGDEAERCAARMVACARALAALEGERGVRVVLAVEPEPGCALQTTPELCAFFAGPLARELDETPEARPHLGACYDVCHQAVLWEDVDVGLDELAAAGVPVARLQASCALELPEPADAEGREVLARFDEPVYLHQVAARDADGELHVADDLRDALADAAWHERGPWRVHYHVPVFRDRAVPPLATTRALLDRALRRVAAGGLTPHVEVETYTWDVLPEAERTAGSGFDLVEALALELEYVASVLGAAGVRGPAGVPRPETA